jgi:RimJ/RimL family protein N-acetyltransferase
LTAPGLVLPDLVLRDGQTTLRTWSVADAEAITTAVAASIEHLRPWMAWAAEQQTVTARRAWILEAERDRLTGGSLLLGVFLDGAVAGGCGLHPRLGTSGLEIGYWIHRAFLRRGLATTASRLLTDAAFALPEISFVEIHHDKANVASGGVPRKLGFELVAEEPQQPQAPGEIGLEWRWRMERLAWQARAPAA